MYEALLQVLGVLAHVLTTILETGKLRPIVTELVQGFIARV